VLNMSLLTMLSIKFSVKGLPFEQWKLPSLRTLGYYCYDEDPDELRSLLCNVGSTITTLSYESVSYRVDMGDPNWAEVDLPDDIWVWCPLLLNLRTSFNSFRVLKPPPRERTPVTVYLIEFDIAHEAPDATYGSWVPLYRRVLDWGPALGRVSFGTTWSTFFSSMELVDPRGFSKLMRDLRANGCILYDREGVSSGDVDTERRFEKASVVYRYNTY
jgi:hypothetical protein